jgi:DNA mismatch repair protein MutL
MKASPPRIDLLPEHLIDQIKAGEVIERPGNLIKEIMENAVDAHSTRLELTIRNNGLDLIALKDNGHGMRFEDLPLAFSRHATSKISRFEDLYRLNSFGFRGEALASISAISRLQCLSFTHESQEGSEIKIEGGQTIYHGHRQKVADQSGTELVIQDLFFNTPARLKFIQSQQAEKTFIKKIIYSFVLSHPEIEFHLKLEEGDKEIIPPVKTLQERLLDLVPRAENKFLYSEKFYENTELQVYLIPGSLRAPVKIQNIYINGRYILDKQLHRVMTNAIASAFGEEDWQYVAFYTLPADNIDVNVHPNKTIIKCLDSSKMISLLTSTVKELAGKGRAGLPAGNEMPGQSPSHQSLFEGEELQSGLSTTRQAYNLEGFFSPHQLPKVREGQFSWIGPFFIREEDNRFWAVSALKLLDLYTSKKLQNSSPSIPLLVSEPFFSHHVKPVTLEKLISAGVELETLGKDTIVLRSIPEWMNGFPLQPVINLLLHDRPLSVLEIVPAEWSQSTWEEMLQEFSAEELIQKNIQLDLQDLLRQRLK